VVTRQEFSCLRKRGLLDRPSLVTRVRAQYLKCSILSIDVKKNVDLKDKNVKSAFLLKE